jgi:dienelactone hydrolase
MNPAPRLAGSPVAARTPWSPLRKLALASIVLLGAGHRLAHSQALVEQTLHVPVHLDQGGGAGPDRELVVTVVRAEAPKRLPFAVILHGRPGDAAGRAAIGQQKYPANARYLARLGFVVLVPTRIGYGVTGGPDVEFTGPCADKRPEPGLAAAVSQTRQLLAYAARLPYVDVTAGVVIGESFGGLAAIAIASTDIPGVQAAVNVAGGDGGSLDHLDLPCGADRLRAALAAIGRSNRLPTLWMYSRNDRLWGPTLPAQWFDAFARAGGRGRFVSLPADRNNGHYVFNRNPAYWHPDLEQFLSTLGLPAAGAPAAGTAAASAGARAGQ